MSNNNDSNPLLQDWSDQPYSMPPFHLIEPTHFEAALEAGMAERIGDLKAIADSQENPTFENVMEAYDRAGKLYKKVSLVYSNMCSSMNTPELQPIQSKMAPILSKHQSACYQIPGLFDRIRAVHDERSTKDSLTSEQVRLIERIYKDFTRAGASLSKESQDELSNLNAELASLMTKFQQNVMKDEELYELVLKEEDMVGCPDFLIEAAKNAAKERNKAADEYVITLSRSLVEPFLTFSDRRDLRKQAFEAWIQRGEMDMKERDNLAIARQILQLRKRVAEIHGFPSFAHYQCDDRMAKTPDNAMKLLEDVWHRAKDAANKERQAMEAYVHDNGEELEEGGIQPYDWRYYAEKVRKSKYNLDEALFKPYLSLDNVRDALFAVSNNLFGLQYKKLDNVEVYHPDVNVYEVTDENNGGKLQAIFLQDNYARANKEGGAWMSEYRSPTKNLDKSAPPIEGIPIVSNNNNFAKSDPILLSYDDAETCFHEAGHGHHSILSSATYGRLSSTKVLKDFVELPSQLMEHWFSEREVLKKYARHYKTGEPVPDEMLDKLEAAKSFQQGFKTIEYTACALLDMALHQIDDCSDFDISEFEKTELERLGMPQGIVMRHRPAHFQHLFSTNSYAAGYYVYLWADVLVADVYAAFEETGNCFDKETAARVRKYIYSAGNTQAPDELFRQFRGRDPDISFLLKERSLV